MGYMRMTRKGSDVVTEERAIGYRYYFTLSKWQAMAYVSNRMIMELGQVDWQAHFPSKVTAAMRYGEALGVEIKTTEYGLIDTVNTSKGVRTSGAAVGAIAMIHSGGRTLGFYAVKY